MGSIHVDLSRPQIMLVTFDGGVTDEQFEDYLRGMSKNLQRRTRTVTILDARRAVRTPPKQRKRQADWLIENDLLLKQFSAGSAFVITSPIVRGVMTAILWISPLPTPHTVVGTLSEAELWASDRLRTYGISLPL
jgi:hypothetical protein